MSKTKLEADKLRPRYFVQWVTKWDDNNHITQILGYCVRDKSDWEWKTVFEHESETVCRKVCDMLNEGS